MTPTNSSGRRRRLLAALAIAMTTMPALAFVVIRTYAGEPDGGAIEISAGAISAEGEGGAEDAVLPRELTRRLVEIDAADYEGNPYVTFSSAPKPATPTFDGLRWPVSQSYRITSPFGPRGKGFHHGIDIGCPLGAPALAAGVGEVVWTGEAPVYGNLVVVHHGSGTVTMYAHLDAFAVTGGDAVVSGQPIGICGTTGRSTGPHLHFEVRYNGRAWDPLRFLSNG